MLGFVQPGTQIGRLCSEEVEADAWQQRRQAEQDADALAASAASLRPASAGPANPTE